jgi:hypothetical protein
MLSVVYDVGGLGGVHLLRALGVTALVLLTVTTARLLTTPLRVAVITLVVTFASSAAWAERPQLAGLVLHAACLLIWIQAWRRHRSPWPAIPLLWLWACIHGTWILGLVVCLIGAGTIACTSGLLSRGARRGYLTALGSAVAVLVTPAGPALILQPFVVSEAAHQVNEWQAPTLDNPTLVASILLFVVTGVVLAYRRRNVLPTAIFGLVGLSLSLYAVRTVAFGAILMGVAAPLALARPRERPAEVTPRRESGLWLTAGLIIAIGATAVSSTRPTLNDPAMVKAVEALPAGTIIVADPQVSGWVRFHTPTLRPLRDLRAEVYSTRAVEAFHALAMAHSGWEPYLTRTGARAALLPTESPLAKALEGHGWEVSVSKNGYVLLMSGSLS